MEICMGIEPLKVRRDRAVMELHEKLQTGPYLGDTT
jgi:hypothetical protein